ncbi:MAG TPA: hypothetical protein VIK79_14015 [Xanthobacteraceae bacterium]
MWGSTIVMIGFAVVFGLLAGFIANMWLNKQAKQQVQAAPTQSIHAADGGRRHGAAALRHRAHRCDGEGSAVAPNSIPADAFGKVADVMAGGRRVVLSPLSRTSRIARRAPSDSRRLRSAKR